MIKKILFLPVRVILYLAGFIFIVGIPVLLNFDQSKFRIELHASAFVEYFFNVVMGFIHLDEIPYLLKYFEGDQLHKYLYSISLLSLSLVMVSVSGFVISTTIMMLPLSIRKRFKSFIDFTTTTPELLIIFLLQYLAIYTYKTFDFKLFRLYGNTNNEPYFVPIVIITFLPTIFLIQFLLKEFTDEEQKEYVTFAKAKGVPKWTIFSKHIFRNVFPLFLIYLKTIVWYLLTNIFVVENIVNMQGIYGVQKFMHRERGIDFILELILFTVPIMFANLLTNIVKMSIKGKE